MKKIVDCFIFYNELELLTYRLNILYDLVDYFIIVESTHTFSGKEKQLYFNENRSLFEKCKDKIIHIVVDDFPYKYPNINYELNEQWVNEKYQRDSISNGIDRLDLNEDDIILITDVDEIPDPNTLKIIKTNIIPSEIYIIAMDFYYYNLNSRCNEKWKHGKLIPYKKYKELSISCDKIRHRNDCIYIEKGGWHLSYFGNENFIKNKIENFSHQELNKSEFTDVKNIEKRVKNFEDLYDRKECRITKLSIAENDYLPPEYDKYLSKFITLYMNIGFFVRQFSERGTEVALYDYAKYNEEILKNKSYIICFKEPAQRNAKLSLDRSSYNKFNSRFPIIEINSMEEMKHVITQYKLSFFYTLTGGSVGDIYQFNNKNIWGNCKTIKHCVFDTTYPEGDFHISISNHLNEKYNTNIPVIPHIVDLPNTVENLRNELNIPDDAIVFGRYGGKEEFNIQMTQEAIVEYVNNNADVYFLFMNTNQFYYQHPRIIHIEGRTELLYKVKFINTCDAMIHSRFMGETFGLSIAEFSIKNKPIITCPCGDLEHVKILGEKAILYRSKQELLDIFKNIKQIIGSRTDWNAYEYFSPENIMELFSKIFYQ